MSRSVSSRHLSRVRRLSLLSPGVQVGATLDVMPVYEEPSVPSCFATQWRDLSPEPQKPAASGLFHVLQICYSKGREPCWISLELIIPSPEL
ncbi:hypothetical protein BCEP27_11285 [Burkholderia cepacia]